MQGFFYSRLVIPGDSWSSQVQEFGTPGRIFAGITSKIQECVQIPQEFHPKILPNLAGFWTPGRNLQESWQE
jgi:hypothetical protein